jgi:hypothetical protein
MEAPLPVGAATVCEVALPRKLHAFRDSCSRSPHRRQIAYNGSVWQNEPKFQAILMRAPRPVGSCVTRGS